MTSYIYVYSLPNVQELNGYVKVGYTKKDPNKRIKEQLSFIPIEFNLLLSEKAVRADGTSFKDHEIHTRLLRKGFNRRGKEWFQCSVDDVQNVIREEKGIDPKKLKNIWGNHLFERKYFNWDMSDGQGKYIQFLYDFEIVGAIRSTEKMYRKNAENFSDLLQEGVFSNTYNNSEVIRSFAIDELYESEISQTLLLCYHRIFQHDILWLTKSGQIFCTSTPHQAKEEILAEWEKLVRDFSFPSTIKICFLREEYNFYSQKLPMIMIYDERRIKNV